MEADRRQSNRRSLDDTVQVQAQDKAFEARLRSLSRIGALVQIDRALPVGTPMVLGLTLPDSREVVEVHAQVVRVEYSGSASAVAVMFAPLSPQALAGIGALLDDEA
jgi:PilZ domain